VIRLKAAAHKRYRGRFEYLVAYDYSAGLPNRYTVLILNVDDPVTVGRELDLATVRGLIEDYEQEAAKFPNWTGGRKEVLACLANVKEKRLALKTSPRRSS